MKIAPVPLLFQPSGPQESMPVCALDTSGPSLTRWTIILGNINVRRLALSCPTMMALLLGIIRHGAITGLRINAPVSMIWQFDDQVVLVLRLMKLVKPGRVPHGPWCRVAQRHFFAGICAAINEF